MFLAFGFEDASFSFSSEQRSIFTQRLHDHLRIRRFVTEPLKLFFVKVNLGIPLSIARNSEGSELRAVI